MGAVAEAAPGRVIDDEAILRRIVAGDDPDHAGFRTLWERHAPEVLRFLRRMLNDDAAADDALQESFVRLHRALPGFDAARPLRPYLLAIARHAAISTLRRKQRAAKIGTLGEEPADAGPPADRAATARDARGRVQEALAALAPEHRAVVLLRLGHGLRLEEVARALDVTDRTVRNRLRAAAVLLERELRRRGLSREDLP
jgi:RNA polymerase sigma-70 factor (ECF subfamily)